MGKSKSLRFVSFSDHETLRTLLKDIKPADNQDGHEPEPDDKDIEVKPEPSITGVTGSKICSLCNAQFSDLQEQRQHFKLDWHRYNLKRKLQSKPVLTEEMFEQLAEKTDLKLDSKKTENQSDDDETSSISGSDFSSDEDEKSSRDLEDEIDQLELVKNRHPKYFFENSENQLLSVFKSSFVDHSSKSSISDSDILSKIGRCVKDNHGYKWGILMLGGGHFAGAIFNNAKPLVHKTFHCYTVRAKQGGSQSMADNKSGTNHPKSAGASLRRYNQAALVDHVRSILTEWKSHLSDCNIIFYRAVSGNRTVLFGDGYLDKKDTRFRTIPFPTRRATFAEVKRVHEILSSVEIHTDTPEFLSESSKRSPTKNVSSKRSNIRRSKSRESPKGLLPKVVRDLADFERNENSPNDESDLSWQDVQFSTMSLSEFENSAPSAPPPRKSKKKNTAQRQQQQEDDPEEIPNPVLVETDPQEELTVQLKNELVTACKSGNVQLLKKCLEDMDGEAVNMEIGIDKWTPLHLAAQGGRKNIIATLLEHGADPAKRNKMKQVPYTMCPDKETRNTFRRFQAENPDKFDYVAALIPVETPLTAEEEARQLAKKAGKEKSSTSSQKGKRKSCQSSRRHQEKRN